MAWSIDVVKPQVDAIFESIGKDYTMTHPNAMSPRVFIQHEGELDVETKRLIVALFPENVYVDFFANAYLGNSTKVEKRGRRIK